MLVKELGGRYKFHAVSRRQPTCPRPARCLELKGLSLHLSILSKEKGINGLPVLKRSTDSLVFETVSQNLKRKQKFSKE